MGLFSYPRLYSGYEDFKTVLTFQNWWENTGDICSQSCLPPNSAVVQIVNPVTKSSNVSNFSTYMV